MRRQVTTLLKSLPEIGNATIFLIFMTTLFAILGLQQFTGIVYYRCRLTQKPINATYWPISHEYNRICSPGGDGDYSCPSNLTCGSPDQYGISLENDGVFNDSFIQYGINSYDNILKAFIGVFQVLTTEEWTSLMYNLADGYSQFFAKAYFCILVIFGHYYMLQLLLAVIISNLSKIQAFQAFEEINHFRRLVELDRKTQHKEVDMNNIENNGFDFQENGEKKATEEKKEANPMSEMAKALKAARAAKMEAQKKAEEEVKKKEEMQTQPMTSMQQMAAAIKRAKEERARKEAEEKAKKEAEEAAKDTAAKDVPDDEKRIELEKQREAAREKQMDDQVKGALMWSVGGENERESTNLSSGLGLALLSRALGVQKMEDKFSRHMNNIKKTKMISKLELRLKLQNKILDDVSRLTRKTDLDVSKMYWRSRKNVYGIDNELHLVEQVQNCMKIIFNDKILSRETITYQDIDKIFEFEKKDIEEYYEPDQAWVATQKRQLDLHMYLALKIAFNLKELTQQQNVRNFFFTRFKRRLIKKSIIDNIEVKIHKYMIETGVLIRARNSRIYTAFNNFTKSRIFKTTTVIAIIANGIVLSISSDKSEAYMQKVLDYMNIGFFCFFVMELLSKLIGQGFKNYLLDKFNWFDGLVVIVSSVDITLTYTIFAEAGNSSSGALTALRVFRLIRIFQLAKLWKDFQELLSVVINTLKDVSNISILILIFVFSYTLIGMELFAYKLPEEQQMNFKDPIRYRSNFNTFIEAFFSVFIVLIGDGWTDVYFDHYRHLGPWVSSLFFMSLIILGQFILMNLFISVLIENFEQLSVRNDLVLKLTDIEKKGLSERLIENICGCFQKTKKVQDSKQKKRSKLEEMMDEKYQEEIKHQNELKIQSPSLFLFSYENILRKKCREIAEHKYFEWIMLAIIILSSIQLGMDNPLNNPDNVQNKVFLHIDYVLSGIFVIEVIIKVIGFGFIFCGTTSYMKSYWNILDFFVIAITIGSYFSTANLNAIKVFKLIKVLRPVRAISKNEGLRISIQTLGVALPGIIDILVVMLLIFFIFGIITLNYFKEKFHYCDPNGLMYKSMQEVYSNAKDKWDCLNSGALWRNKFMNFDSTPEAMATLFIISNSVQWRETLYRVMLARESDDLPSSTIQSIPAGLFLVFINIIGNFFILNLFMGIVISKYNRERELHGKNFYLTEGQKKWVKNRLNILQAQPKYRMKMPFNGFSQPFFFIAESQYVQMFIMLCIVLNTIILTMQWYGQPQQINQILENLNYIFAFVFTCELIVKYVGYGQRFFYDGWNTFDMIIVIMTLLGIIMNQQASFSFGPQTTIVRSFRIVRVFYFFKKNKALRGTLMTFMISLPAMANIGSLLLLIIMIYAILGVYLFAEVKMNGAIDEHANFQTIGCAFLTLVRTITGENWPLLMEALSRKNDIDYDCIDNPSYSDYVNNHYNPVGCGNRALALIYFFSFSLFVSTIFMRLFIAIILQTFQQTTERDNKFMNTELSNRFREVWSRFDGNATSFMRSICYPKFLLLLGEPMGWDTSFEHNYLKQQEYLREISLNKYNTGQEYYFMDVFEQLILIMIIRREVINFGIKTKHLELVGAHRKYKEDEIDEQYILQDDIMAPLLNKSLSSNSSQSVKSEASKDQLRDLKSQEKKKSDPRHDGGPDDKSNKVLAIEDLVNIQIQVEREDKGLKQTRSSNVINRTSSLRIGTQDIIKNANNEGKDINEMTLIRFESHDYLQNTPQQLLTSQNTSENVHRLNTNQKQRDAQTQQEDVENEQERLTNHDGGVTGRDTDADIKESHRSQQTKTPSKFLDRKNTLRNLKFGFNLDFKPKKHFDGDNTYVDILNDPSDEPVEFFTEEKLIQYELRAMEEEQMIDQITKGRKGDMLDEESAESDEDDSMFDQEMKVIEEEMETINRKKELDVQEEPDIEKGSQIAQTQNEDRPQQRNRPNPVLIINPNVKEPKNVQKSLPQESSAQSGKSSLRVIKSIIDIAKTKKPMPFKPEGALGKPKTTKHKD